MTDENGKFDLSKLVGSTASYEFYSGSDNSYLAIAKKGESRLAMCVEGALSSIKIGKKQLQVIGFGLRLIAINPGAGAFSEVFGIRGNANFNGPNGMVSGMRLIKTYLPLCQFPTDPKSMYSYAEETAIPQLVGWLKESVAKAGGEMVLDDLALAEHLKGKLPVMDTSFTGLFHLPGQKPTWAGPELEEPPLPKHSPKAQSSGPFAEAEVEEDYDVYVYTTPDDLSKDEGDYMESSHNKAVAEQVATDYLAEDDDLYAVVVKQGDTVVFKKVQGEA